MTTKLNVIGEIIPGKVAALKLELTPEQLEQCAVAGVFYFLRLGIIAAPAMGSFSEVDWEKSVEQLRKLDDAEPVEPFEVN